MINGLSKSGVRRNTDWYDRQSHSVGKNKCIPDFLYNLKVRLLRQMNKINYE